MDVIVRPRALQREPWIGERLHRALRVHRSVRPVRIPAGASAPPTTLN